MNSTDGTIRDFARWPGYYRKWRELFKYIWDNKTETKTRDGRKWFGDRYFNTWEELFDWWADRKRKLPDEKEECQGLTELFS
jgi:hypothetical protein